MRSVKSLRLRVGEGEKARRDGEDNKSNEKRRKGIGERGGREKGREENREDVEVTGRRLTISRSAITVSNSERGSGKKKNRFFL